MCKNNVKTLIRYIYNRYTYAKQRFVFKTKEKETGFRSQMEHFILKLAK